MKNERKVVSTGTISIFLILVVLLFVTFSLLSLTLSTSDLRLSERAAETSAEYYAADDAATRQLYRYVQAAESGGLSAVKEAVLSDGGGYEDANEDGVVSFSVPVNDGLCLYAEARLSDTGDKINITRWQCAGGEQ